MKKTVGVEVKELTKEFHSIYRGKTVALNSIHLKIEGGEFFVLLGPSGCGKSTFLNLIAGLEKPTRGEIWFGKKPVCVPKQGIFLSPKERNIAMVFQSYALYPHMSVFDNIAFPLKIAGEDKKLIKTKVEEVAKTLSIYNLLMVKPKELSGGQRQRVAIGRAIVRSPALFLLDEPLSNLDAQLRINMRSELKTLQRKLGITTIYVTHDQVEAMTLGDRIAVLKEGKVQQVGNPVDVFNKPVNIFVAKFLGTPPMNLLKGEIFELSKKVFARIGNFQIEVPENIKKIVKEKYIFLGIRAEDIKILPENYKEGFKIKIDLVEPLGNEGLLYFTLGKNKIVAKAPGDMHIKEGEYIKILFNKEKIHWFREDGKRISDE